MSVYEPKRLTERMASQQGTFLWPGNPDLTVMENLAACGDLAAGVRQIVIPTRQRGRALEQLRLMNITRTSLFPGLDGFAHSFRHMYVREPAKDRALRMAILGLQDAVRPINHEKPKD